jgi:hypothetical protein
MHMTRIPIGKIAADKQLFILRSCRRKGCLFGSPSSDRKESEYRWNRS